MMSIGRRLMESAKRGSDMIRQAINPEGSIAKVQKALQAEQFKDVAPMQYSRLNEEDVKRMGLKKGGTVKSSASKRADGIAQRGKTKGRYI